MMKPAPTYPADPAASGTAPQESFSRSAFRASFRQITLSLALGGILAAPSLASAQASTDAVPAGALAGRVVDAATGEPVRDALITLEAAPVGLLFEMRSPPTVRARQAVTAPEGLYRFADVPPGRYSLTIERIGYRTTRLDVEVRRPVQVSVSVGLEIEPVALAPMEVVGGAAPLFQRAANRLLELEDVRAASEQARQALFLTPDARMLTYADVMDGVTLGEGDVFRALQRFPGVGTRDDYTAELWTRGAPWTHTRVTFDGVPLFNPVHAVGVLSAISPEVLGAVFFHPGVRPASLGEGAAGVVDLRSRPGGGGGEVRSVLDLSTASAKIALDQSFQDRGAWVVAARRSHLDALSSGLGWIGLDTLDLPYVFHDVAGRGDLRLGSRAGIEASGLWEEDRLQGDIEGVLERTEARWGNTAGRVTLRLGMGGLELGHTVGRSQFSARTDERLVRTRDAAPAWNEPESDNQIRHTGVAGELAPAGDAPPTWSLGYEVARSHVRYVGPLPRYYAVRPDTLRTLHYGRDLTVASVWGDRRVALGSRVLVNPGLRVEVSDSAWGAARVGLAPRLAIRVAASPAQTVSLAAGRSWQYAQAIALAGPSVHPAFHASHFWIWADGNAPALRSDLASLGTERWFAGGWLGSATVFARRSTGVMVPDPTPGRLGRRPLFVVGENHASGAELGLRRLGATWSVSLGYSYADSRIEVDTLSFPSPADRRHIFNAMVGGRVLPPFRLALAYTAMSGAPFTRAFSVIRGDCEDFGFGCGNPEGSYVQAPNAERTPGYHSLDASLHWSSSFGGAQLSGYLQVRNILGHDNASTYSGSHAYRALSAAGSTVAAFEDRFEEGLPRVPLVGVRLTF